MGLVFFFFKQKTAYEMQRGLVGSEMCIRDRYQRRVHGHVTVFEVDSERDGVNYLLEDRNPKDELFMQINFFQSEIEFIGCITNTKRSYLVFNIEKNDESPVSYTHLTLPTILLVQISVVAVSFTKKNILICKHCSVVVRVHL
eukprot:TRINITY_DN11112_c0_g1_i1.p1 TRINITY_DN11112_c0_g1~~TRINITY_DN11112_c0_g1_i1.p1  ORF type:complete len:143 (+),score=50.08 TRINITY_DN11112_c0_g1_i1:55-483(+)